MSGRLVFVNDVVAGHTVDDRYCFRVSGYGLFFVARGDGVHDLLNAGAYQRSARGVLNTTFFRLAGALARLGGICQLTVSRDPERRATMLIHVPVVNVAAIQAVFFAAYNPASTPRA